MSLLDNQEFVSTSRGLPVETLDDSQRVEAITGETVQMYYFNAGVLTIDAGQAAGTIVVAKLAQGTILNELNDMPANENDTSLSFTSTALTAEVSLNSNYDRGDRISASDRAIAITAGFSNGDYAVDYVHGVIYGVKASTQVTLTSTSYDIPVRGGSATFPIGAIDGTGTHDDPVDSEALQSGLEAKDFDGSSLPNPVNAEGDMVREAGTLSGVGYVMPVNEDGSETPIVAHDAAISAANGGSSGFMVMGEGRTSQQTAVDSADGARLTVNQFGELVVAGYNWNTQSNTTAEVSPVSSHHVEETLVDITNGADGTYYYYVDLDGYRNFAAQLTLSGGSGTATVTLEASVQDDGTAPASVTYQDVTNDLFGVASTTASDMWIADTPMPFKFIRYKVVAATGAADDADWTIYHKKLY